MNNSNRQLLFSINKKDLNITYFSGKGGGGQHRNRHKNCVRINHKDSGVMVTGQSHKSKRQNEREALQNLIKHPKFKVWHAKKCDEIINKPKSIKELVEEEMNPINLKEEVWKDGKWVEKSAD